MVSDAEHEAEPGPSSAEQRAGSRRSLQWTSLYLLLSVVLGALGAVAWRLIVQLPTYTVQSDGKAVTTQAGLTQVFQSDAWFAGIGAVSGLLLGLLAWRWFRTLGWLAPVLAGLAALVAGVACWQLGSLLGPGPFEQRLAAANPGDVVPISLELHAPVALALWVMMAQLPVLIAASFLRDPEDPPARSAGEIAAVPPVDGPIAGEGPAGRSPALFSAPGGDMDGTARGPIVLVADEDPSATEVRGQMDDVVLVDSPSAADVPLDDVDASVRETSYPPHDDSSKPAGE
jgi:hypothetical protein